MRGGKVISAALSTFTFSYYTQTQTIVDLRPLSTSPASLFLALLPPLFAHSVRQLVSCSLKLSLTGYTLWHAYSTGSLARLTTSGPLYYRLYSLKFTGYFAQHIALFNPLLCV